ncbi:GNAT family N-acetyltransferase [Hymenobacter metallilatus]|uniref:GNAT family N-acetyltransferase n=1 Tax=Hymenobacter metallilatus TaxID=2493666 RepID=A0A428JQZ0_9BACT|nr:GNAT family N-acetyltransferase [Hymenobacter metallilatus]RSK36062.1 GNAT family N-acetyltransferase [Hymenobacter metallilatus]
MANSDEITLHRATAADLADVVELNRVENDDDRMTTGYLDWWYFNNPFNSFSFFLSRIGGRACGMCSSNDAQFVINGRPWKAGFIQKVLTSNEVRGKGLFGKLYVKTDTDFLERGGDCFLAFPNAVAKPIYLAKYSYSHGIYPDLTLLFTNPLHLAAGSQHEVVTQLDSTFFRQPTFQFENAMKKDEKFLNWRYLTFKSEHYKYVALAVKQAGKLVGYAFLKKIQKKGLPVFVLMDVAFHQQADLAHIIKQARIYAAKQLSVGLLYMGNPLIDAATKGVARKVWRNQFDFLVKGKNQAETDELAKVTFNFFFGDLDFV